MAFRSRLNPFRNIEPYLSGNTLSRLYIDIRSCLVLFFIVVFSLCFVINILCTSWDYDAPCVLCIQKKNKARRYSQHIFIIVFHDKLDMFRPFLRPSSGPYT